MWGVKVFEIGGISEVRGVEVMSEVGEEFRGKLGCWKELWCWWKM